MSCKESFECCAETAIKFKLVSNSAELDWGMGEILLTLISIRTTHKTEIAATMYVTICRVIMGTEGDPM